MNREILFRGREEITGAWSRFVPLTRPPQSWLACGLYNKPYSGERIMGRALYDATNRRTAERREAEAAPIDGQMDLFEEAEP